MFKANVALGKLRVPVKLYAAVQDRAVHFRMLHADDHVPIRQRMVDVADHAVAPEEIRRGYPIDRAMVVLLEDEELRAAEPEPSRDIVVSRFVDEALIDDRWYDRPYYLGPDGDDDGYAALAASLGERGVEGVAHWVMRKHAYVGALRAEGPQLVLIRMRFASEIVAAAELPKAPARKTDAKELALAQQLLDALEAPFDPHAYHDEYQERVRKLALAKAHGKKLPKARAPKRPAVRSLEAALRASLGKHPKKKVA
jgi:DNA end-binding protein Ku